MLRLILLLTAATALADNCSHVFDNKPYSRTTLLTIKGLPTNLVYNPKNKELLFTLIDVETLQNDNVQTKMDQYVAGNGEAIKIDNVKGQAAAVDVTDDKVYIATDDGLNVLNNDDKATFVGLNDTDIVQLFKPVNKKELYAVIFPENEVFVINTETYKKNKIENVPCAYILAVDSSNNIFYECDSKYVKVLLKDFQEPVEFVGLPKNSARAMNIDKNDRVILAANDGLYRLRPDNIIPNKLMNLDFVPAGIAFDGDDIYISANDVIYKYDNENC